jgi:GlpG protein
LVSIGIPSQVDSVDDVWEVWVRDEDQLPKAKIELDTFLSKPNDQIYAEAELEAKKIRSQQVSKRKEAAKNKIDMRTNWSQPVSKRAPITMGLVYICAFLFLLINLGGNRTLKGYLELCEPSVYMQTGDVTYQIRNGQIWRLLTANLMHGDVLHILFNMYWLVILGGQVEYRKKPGFYIGLLFATALGSMGLYLVMSPGLAVGMSGVVYGLFGYIWMKAKHDRNSGFVIDNQTVLVMIVWFFICFAGVIGNVANWAHAGGLATGMAIAYLPLQMKK